VKRRSARGVLLAGVILLGSGGALRLALTPAAAPAELQAAAEVTSAPVGREDLTDEHTVKVVVRQDPAPHLVIGSGGRVTASRCAPGKVLASGRVVARLDGTPLMALATSVPLYRSLGRGHEGDDVKALQRELVRLGYAVEVDGVFDLATLAAVKALQRAAGVDRPNGVIDPGKILWLPAPSVVPDACGLAVGAYVSPGHTYAEVPARLSSIVVESMPPNLVPGERNIRLAGITGPLDADGTATDAKFLDKVAGTREFRLVEETGKASDITATIELRKPIRTLKVPPGALFAVDRNAGCIQSGAQAYAVKIMGSRLGATLVVAKGEAPASVNLGSTITLNSCG
jgi:peptidoglycan hydrolase-like protein with peptidoglycan-binding domain